MGDDQRRRDYMANFGARLRGYRLEAGYTNRTELAEKVGTSEATFGRWENGSALPDLWETLELVRLLGERIAMDEDELLHPEPLTPLERRLARHARQGAKTGVKRALGDGRGRG